MRKCPVNVGDKFGKLEVLEEAERKRPKNRRWKCQCKCGNIMYAETNTLTSGHSTTCGCGRLEAIYHGGIHITATWYGTFKRNAKKRKLEFDLTFEFLDELWAKQNGKCALTGMDIKIEKCRSGKKYYSSTTASLDRIDNTKGYIEGNVQFVHKHINYMKWTHSQKYFIDLCKAVVYYVKSNENNFETSDQR